MAVKPKTRIILILHNIRSLHNVGSIFRTADAAGAGKIYLCGITPAPTDRFGNIRPRLAKVSLGAEKTVEWDASARSSRATLKLLEKLKKDGYKIFAVEQAKNSVPYYKIILRGNSGHSDGIRSIRIALIFGNEVNGLPSSILRRADKILEIPMRGNKESLNVSVAAGVVLFRILYP